MGFNFECEWARTLSERPNTPDKAIELLDYAMAIRMYGERAPGGKENWGDWDVVAEDYLRTVKGLGHE